MNINKYIQQNSKRLSDREMSKKLKISITAIRHRRQALGIFRTAKQIDEFRRKAMKLLRLKK